MAKEKTQKYVVIKRHTLGHGIGDEINLTETGAKNLVGKVRLKSEGAEGSPLNKASSKLKKQNEDLTNELKDLKEKVEGFKVYESELLEKIDTLNKEIDGNKGDK